MACTVYQINQISNEQSMLTTYFCSAMQPSVLPPRLDPALGQLAGQITSNPTGPLSANAIGPEQYEGKGQVLATEDWDAPPELQAYQHTGQWGQTPPKHTYVGDAFVFDTLFLLIRVESSYSPHNIKVYQITRYTLCVSLLPILPICCSQTPDTCRKCGA